MLDKPIPITARDLWFGAGIVAIFASSWAIQVMRDDTQDGRLIALETNKANTAYVVAEIDKVKIEEAHRDKILQDLIQSIKELTKAANETNIKLAKMED